MQLLLAILFALNVFIESGLTTEQIQERCPAKYAQAKTIIDSNTYTIDPVTGAIVIDETGN